MKPRPDIRCGEGQIFSLGYIKYFVWVLRDSRNPKEHSLSHTERRVDREY